MPGTTRTKPSGKMAELAKLRSQGGELLPVLKEQMLLDTSLPGDRDARVLHVSDLVHADTCHRAVTARMLGLPLPPESFSFQRENIFDEGNTIHRKWQHRMRRTRKLYGQWACAICGKTETGLEPPVRWDICVNPSVTHIWEYQEIPLWWEPLLLSGHADGGIGTAIVELKSIGTGTLRFEAPRILADNTFKRNGRDIIDTEAVWADIRRPFRSHVKQGNLYCWLARQLGLPFDHVVFIYEFKPNQSVREFLIRPSRDILTPMLTTAGEIAAAVRERRLVECPSGGCRKCEGIDANGITQAPPADRPGQSRSRRQASRAGHRRADRSMVPAAGNRTAGDPQEPASPAGRGPDGLVPPGQPVAQVPAAAAGSGRGRRVVRRSQEPDSGGHSTGEGRRQDSSGDESTGTGRRVVRRSGSGSR